MSALRIGIAGVGGRVGRLLVEEVRAAGHVLAGGTARAPDAGLRDLLGEAPVLPGLSELAPLCDVVIDFTHASVVHDHALILAQAGVAWVLGTTGLDPEAVADVHAASGRIAVVQAANFSPGVVLVTRLARLLGAALPAPAYDAEIVEMHHRQKVDAPSGTALAIGEAVADGRGVRLADVRVDGRSGHTGPRGEQQIGFAALRGGQIVGEHSALFTSASEQIVLTHRAFDRRVYATGAVRAADWLRGRTPGLYSMEQVLGLV
ncbi:dihydrodipicolinate reductase [Ameyamaea chiangmaiensis NBRC 103196]|uniref:4-hydroxy-tetrahydrodipicolinate reductase n=1 Tax=Ameyamaea chiangmaiensis TaxID=442969 RepID=A0A850PAR1_9PROT|nr:4-hydroxy-tetrahydrodipicolinate reductase [Ameyamaea chiangmaiensis]MBS4075301.1 4-hydroxy-tetrahydrodipicolinate reductase [Ameyamaea chiangmaiensis]NVN41038.1 4-hydroxy-tetrahydrodipicolinate reductase [Ameyamaea chiangmaiensis]GBQ66692.1 dihydrodipicolinate reductase [Ameyamaea chiangmaiensis NBRC 103196]